MRPTGSREPKLAQELERRDELLIACRAGLLGIATSRASALVAHIDALLDSMLDLSGAPESVPGSSCPHLHQSSMPDLRGTEQRASAGRITELNPRRDQAL
jgi:hypothetical protein